MSSGFIFMWKRKQNDIIWRKTKFSNYLSIHENSCNFLLYCKLEPQLSLIFSVFEIISRFVICAVFHLCAFCNWNRISSVWQRTERFDVFVGIGYKLFYRNVPKSNIFFWFMIFALMNIHGDRLSGVKRGQTWFCSRYAYKNRGFKNK